MALRILLASVPALAAAASSGGCGKASPVPQGRTATRYIEVDGLRRLYLLRVPRSYDASRPTPLILSHGGWTVTAEEDETDSGLSDLAEEENYIVAYPQGWDDNDHRANFDWDSWNTVGSGQSTREEPGCYAWGGTKQYCYESCADRTSGKYVGCDSMGCDWTTCVDSTAFNVALLDLLEDELCVDTAREYATGQSNGAIYTFRLGVVLADRLAAIAPISGSFMNGWITPPSNPMPVLDCTGTKDVTVPINDTAYGDGPVSSEGWIYSLMTDIFAAWEPANGCSSSDVPAHWPTPLDGTDQLYCWGKTCGGENPVIRCAWNGGHNYFGNTGRLNSRLVWSFLSQFTREAHLGKGLSSAAPVAATNATILSSPARPSPAALAVTRAPPPANATSVDTSRPHYGDPKARGGCRHDEDELTFAEGVTCAPKMLAPGGAPTCDVGGYRNEANGCPADHAKSPDAAALSTTCLAISAETDAPVGSDFHCVLSCDRTASLTSPDPTADAACPGTGRCVAGHTRLLHVGICVYDE